ncbi:unnamed protein product [Caenorhabditis auriculariae]|uniref:Uncharacterized protein n=1 Tax=Caenorhabditis auriculariae TaxID=2777116 RepID=A0A8S1HP90_9PELO|nr:unnamed protein product [Caenorhabditis auriculariae]
MDVQIPTIQIARNLLEYATRGNLKKVEEESRREDVDPNITDAEGNTPLILASQAGYTHVVEMLLEKFPTINIDQTNFLGQTALIKSAIQGRVSCARLLLRAGADPNKRDNCRGFCALQWAEYVGRTECRHMIAHYMLQPATPIKRKKKTSVVRKNDLHKVTAVATVPLLGDSVETVIPRPRLGSAPIPRLEITVAPDMIRKHSYGAHRRPKSSMC